MKYLKIILSIIVLLAIIFFGNGLRSPTISYQNEIVVNKSAIEVWTVMADPTKMGEWLPGFIRIEPVSGVPGTVGAVSQLYFIEDGQEMVIEETITKVIPNEEMAMTFTMDFMNMDYEIFFNEDNGQTKILSNSITEGNGLFAKSILSFMTGMMRSQEDENLTRLKAVIEK